MRSLIICILLTGCASDIERINSEVNATRPYKTYYARDYRYLKPGEHGNCAAITETKRVELSRIGISSQVIECKLKDGPYHALLKTPEGYADNRHNFLVSWAETGCLGKEK